jgi:hypothetical protein
MFTDTAALCAATQDKSVKPLQVHK